MNYDRYTKDPKNSALFNGNMTSMGGNGAPDAKYAGVRTGNGLIKTGGGGDASLTVLSKSSYSATNSLKISPDD